METLGKDAQARVAAVVHAIAALADLGEPERVAAYNAITRAAADVVRDICDDPVLAISLERSEEVLDNDYNPNHTPPPEMELLEVSIREDGVTMPVVTAIEESGARVTVDGFHRRVVIVYKLKRRYVPCSTIRDGSLAHRKASTVRHNRARGKHLVDRMGELVRSLMDAGWEDEKIAHHLGMSVEELLRLKQVVGAAKLLAAKEYGPAWKGKDGEGLDTPPAKGRA